MHHTHLQQPTMKLQSCAFAISMALLSGDLATALPIPNPKLEKRQGFWASRKLSNFDGKYDGERLYDPGVHHEAWIGNDSYGNTEPIMENESSLYHHPVRKTAGAALRDRIISESAPMSKTNLFQKRTQKRVPIGVKQLNMQQKKNRSSAEDGSKEGVVGTSNGKSGDKGPESSDGSYSETSDFLGAALNESMDVNQRKPKS